MLSYVLFFTTLLLEILQWFAIAFRITEQGL